MSRELKIIYMGTPEFAVPSLKALLKKGYCVKLVVTQPDRPKGRGRKLVAPPVKTEALSCGCEVIQPSTIKPIEFADTLSRLKPDLFVVVAYGHILPAPILAIPTLGAINIHASLLPKYRGSAPIQWAIINGENETGVTSMLLDKGLDTGDILLSLTEKIQPDDTSESLHDRLSVLGSELLLNTLEGIQSSAITPTPQDHGKATYAPLLKKEDGHINWRLPAHKIETFIRGMNPWPGAFAFLDAKRFKIFKARPIHMECKTPPGAVIKGFENELRVATGEGALSILEIQGESEKRLRIIDFLRGKQIPAGSVFC